MNRNQIQTEYTEDQLFILNDIADEQERVMQDEIDEEKDKDFFDEINLFEEEEDYD